MNKTLTALLLTLVGLTACITEDDYTNNTQGNFEALWTIIDEHYCFFDYKKEAYGLDWNEVHTRYAPKFEQELSPRALFDSLASMLAELRDGHVNLYASHDMARYWTWQEAYPANFSDSLQRAYLGTDYRIASGLKYKMLLPDSVGYLTCSSFDLSFGDGNVSEALYTLRYAKGLIIDVRGNGGGQVTNAELLASHFTKERTLVGYICHKTGKGHNDFSTPEEEWLEPTYGVKWLKPTIILTNRQCYSACNDFVKCMKAFTHVHTLGDQTGGGSGLPFSSELPNGWKVRYSACPTLDRNLHHIEFGIKPDYPVSLKSEDYDHGHDTLIDTAVKILAKKK